MKQSEGKREENKVLLFGCTEEVTAACSEVLAQLDFSYALAADEHRTIEMLDSDRYDLLCIEIAERDLRGLELCRKLRQSHPTQMIVLICRAGQETSALIGMEVGADDYLPYPLNTLEAQARVRALIRRFRVLSGQNERIKKLKRADITIDLERRCAFLKERKVNLTPIEFDFLRVFLENPEQTYTREDLVEEVWSDAPRGYVHNVRSHISNLRAKLKAAGACREYIRNERGFGYRFIELEDVPWAAEQV